MKPESLKKTDSQYQKINAAIDKILEKIHKTKNEDEKNDLKILLEEQLYVRQQIENTILSKELDSKKLSQRMLKEAFGNVLLFLIHKSDDIIDALEALEAEGMEIPSGPKAFKRLCEQYGEERVISIIETKTIHVKYVESAIEGKEELLLDYEWIMEDPKESTIPFIQCCNERGINYKIFRHAIRTAFSYSTQRLVTAYEKFKETDETKKTESWEPPQYSVNLGLAHFLQ